MNFSQKMIGGNVDIILHGKLSPEEIKEIRKELRLTQVEAAMIFGGGPNAFSRYEHGKSKPPKSTCNLMMTLLGLKKAGEELYSVEIKK